MRIIAGEFKGRKLQAPPGSDTRPTSDRLRETLFNVIAADVQGARVLDGFAGTGAVGLEALSRGAAHAVFVEKAPGVIRILEKNVEVCRAAESVTIVKADFAGSGKRHELAGGFNIIFLDPPYDLAGLETVVGDAGGLLLPGGLLVLEHSRRRESPASAGRAARYRVLSAGDSALSFYRASAPGEMT